MPSNAFSTVFSQGALRDAWRYLLSATSRQSRNTVGVDDVSINDFLSDEKGQLNRLVRDVRQQSFRFSLLRPHLIPKSNGKDRLICVPTVRDRIVQRALLDFIATRYADKFANNVSYGFVKKRGVKKAVVDACALRAEHPWVFKTDITSFFDRIDRSRLTSAIRRSIRERSLHETLLGAVSCEIQPAGGNTGRRIKQLGIRRGLGVRQGMPLSPFFSNIMLADFDRSIETRGLRAVRYADDLIFFADSRDACEALAAFCAEQLGRIGLEIPPVAAGTKSVIYAPEQPAEFLGVSLVPITAGYRVELTRSQIDRVRDQLLALGSINELVARCITLPKIGQVLTARKNGYLAAYDICHNIDALEHGLADLEQRILRQLYRDGLHIDLGRLSNVARTFLGLR
ncbi:RNA-directed DNA polymerase [Trinickia violacea]|uniref:RNA-directed DNA polymerase n=1 Tax=Trinickia violacea TaxID=2571746 RepID=A0A4P8INF6_9BURK|nr:reverse transcriptase domain-containing protein [Trinickia violacea]QCP48433.1 RNA-directed DNA polymerase [Trinickia violacea]